MRGCTAVRTSWLVAAITSTGASIVVACLLGLPGGSVHAQSTTHSGHEDVTGERSSADEDSGLHGHTGEAAVRVLERRNRTTLTAARAGVTPEALRHALRTDPTAFLDAELRLAYAEALPTDTEGSTDQSVDGGAQSSPDLQAVDVFQLSSNPEATRKIYLDFDGHWTSGSSWNHSYTSGEAFYSGAFDLDGEPTTFNDAERAAIYEIWRSVAEDYAPFNVDVTTIEPPPGGLVRSGSGDQHYGVRVVVSSTDWFRTATGSSTGGVAYVNTFRAIVELPAFVFAGNLQHHPKYVAEGVSHEAGHTLGLLHHGTNNSEYYNGHGDWAPIMGNSYHRPISQWSHGEYTNANRPTQDDIATIASKVGYVNDDHGDTPETATTKTPGTTIGGLINRRNDTDTFTLTLDQPGILDITIAPDGTPTNLHPTAEIRASDNTLITGLTPAAPTNWNLTAALSLEPDTYTIHITGTGWQTPTTGFTDYASLGTYTLTTHHTPDPEPEPEPEPPTTEPPAEPEPPADDDESVDSQPPATDEPVGDTPDDGTGTGDDSAGTWVVPSTNEANAAAGQPHVRVADSGPGWIRLEFVNPASWFAVFEVRIDDRPGTTREHDVIPNEVRYPILMLRGNDDGIPRIVSATLRAGAKIDVRLALGSERDWDFGWTTFEVPPATAD